MRTLAPIVVVTITVVASIAVAQFRGSSLR